PDPPAKLMGTFTEATPSHTEILSESSVAFTSSILVTTTWAPEISMRQLLSRWSSVAFLILKVFVPSPIGIPAMVYGDVAMSFSAKSAAPRVSVMLHGPGPVAEISRSTVATSWHTLKSEVVSSTDRTGFTTISTSLGSPTHPSSVGVIVYVTSAGLAPAFSSVWLINAPDPSAKPVIPAAALAVQLYVVVGFPGLVI